MRLFSLITVGILSMFFIGLTNIANARFIEPDPIGLDGGLNMFSYAGNNPVNFVDPQGLTWESNWNFFRDWTLGRGSNNRFYGHNTVEFQEMKYSVGARNLRNKFKQDGCVFATLKLSHFSPFDTRKLSHPGLSPRMVLEDVTSFGLGGRKGCSTWWTWNTFVN
jgi:hypothetical protein